MSDDETQKPSQAQNIQHKTRTWRFRDLNPHIFLAAALLSLFFSSPVYASALRGPWGKAASEKICQGQSDQGLNPLRLMVDVYRTYISPIDGRNCPMYPTCSEYSLMCFERHGLIIGWVMTCDRLFRCGRDELILSPQIILKGEPRCYDPVENNDFWWYHGR